MAHGPWCGPARQARVPLQLPGPTLLPTRATPSAPSSAASESVVSAAAELAAADLVEAVISAAAALSAAAATDLAADCWPGPGAAAEGRAAGQGVCLSAPLAADFGPDLEAAVEGRLMTREYGSHCLCGSLTASGCARRRWWRGAPLEKEIASRYIRALARVCLYVVSERAPTRHVPPTSPSLAGKPGGGGERGTGAARRDSCSGGGLAGRTCCCRWLWRVLLAISRMLCSAAVSGFVLPTESDLRRKKRKQARKEVTLHLPLSAGAGWPGGSGTAGAPTAAAGRLACWTAAGYMYVLVCV